MNKIILTALLALVALPAQALDKPEEIRACARGNFPATSSSQTFLLTTYGRDESKRSLHATAYWKRGSDGKAKVMLTVDQPDDLKGSAYLILEKDSRDDLYMYLPAARRTKRIMGNQTSDALWGTDFSYEDIKQVQGIFDTGKLTREADAEIAGKPVYVLSFVPDKAEESAYKRLVSFIDKETCVALQTDFYEAGDAPRKRLSSDPKQVKQEGKRWVAAAYEMKDLRDSTRSELLIEKISADIDIPDRLFNPQTFQLGR